LNSALDGCSRATMAGPSKKRKSNERRSNSSDLAASVACIVVPPAFRDVYVHFSSSLGAPVVSVKEESDGGIYRISRSSLDRGAPTRLHFQGCMADMKFPAAFQTTIRQAHINLYLSESQWRLMTHQLKILWNLLASFPTCIEKVVIRLADADDCPGQEGFKINEAFLLDESSFFDVDRICRLCTVFPVLEMHVKCNAIQAEHVGQLVEFLNAFKHPRRLLVYISEFKLFLASICVSETDGRFKSLNAAVKVTQVGELVTLTIGMVRIRFEDEFRGLEFCNFE
ncbi:hypothetical protein PFISCL1PPCAC_17537, partial [Pristionchus fissidentatus]